MMPAAVSTVFIGILGACVGSFLNVVVLRTRSRKSFLKGRSRCPKCRKNLAWFDLIPIVSYLALRGRCRRCRKPIHPQYVLVEALTAAGFLLVWSQFGLSWLTLAGLVVVAAMLLLGAYDARWQLLPDAFTIVLALGAAAVVLISGASLMDALIGAAAGGLFFFLQYFLSRRKWVGSGDVLLGAGIGLLLGWRMLGVALLVAYLTGALVAVWLMAARKLKASSAIAFGPYLLLGTFVAWLYGELFVQWYLLHATF